MDKRISINPETVSVTLELPFEVAELIADQGMDLVKAIVEAVELVKRNDERRKRLEQYQDADAQDRTDEWHRLAAELDAEIKRLTGSGGVTEAEVITTFASNFSTPVSSLQAILTSYRKKQRKAAIRERDEKIIRFYFLGYTNAQIGKKLEPPVSASTVNKVLAKHRDFIAMLRTSRGVAHQPTSPPAPLVGQGAPPEATKADRLPSKPKEKTPAAPRAGGTVAASGIKDELARDPISIQVYRSFRRGEHKADTRHATLKAIGEPHGITAEIAEFKMRHRREHVQRYIKRRRIQSIKRLKAEGLTDASIAERLNISKAKVAKLAKELAGSLPGTDGEARQ
ncbi:MAG: hypothetical protein KI792_08415 [Alphaproteobacteria bacterium]|nr:hypothetical protein [Alphaproteobacteria bacterium SS10]